MTAFKILLVDDEKLFVETLAQRLRYKGFAVDCVFSGTDALKLLENDDTIDVVVLDIKMPDLDGIETVKAIRKKEREAKLFGARTKPYISNRERNELIDGIMKS